MPDHGTDALNQAVDLLRAGDTGSALPILREAARLHPDWDEPPQLMAESSRDSAVFRSVLALNPNRVEALLALAALALDADRLDVAITPLLRCCGLAPRRVEAWRLLGRAWLRANKPKLALSAFAREQALAPRSYLPVQNLVDAAARADKIEWETARQNLISTHDPLNPVPHALRGLLLDRLGLLDAAIDALEAATALAPGDTEPHAYLGAVLTRTTRARQAEAALRRASELDPGNPRLLNDRAAMLMRLHRHAEARDLLHDVLRRDGPRVSVLCNLANATCCVGSQEDAVELARAALALDPVALMPRRTLANTLPYLASIDGAMLLRAARDCAALLPRGVAIPAHAIRMTGKTLTIGLLSGTLRTHPVGWLTVAGLEHLDHTEFEIVCLSRAPEPTDPIARRFRARARSWENVVALDDDALARRARALGIDILIDLGGHGDAGRMVACAHRLAPVQIKWVGMQNHSTGLPEMDWFLTDRWETPPGFERFYSERLLRMRDGYVCYCPPPHAPDVVEAPVLMNRFTTFGCFNNIAKITDLTVETWCDVLRSLPDSRLVLKTHQFDDPQTATYFLARFTRSGIDPARIEIQGASPHRIFLESYNKVDLVLDPHPYSGGLTTCEALWMGVPTVTLPGETFASRHSASHISNAGYPAFVARDRADYVAIALRWARDPNSLAAMRREMRARVWASPLCDAPRFGRSLGDALRHAWTA